MTKPAKPKKIGRPSSFTQEIADEICAHIAEGKALATWCRNTGIGYSTVMQWLNANPAFAENYTRARVDSGDADADLMNDLRDRVLAGEVEPTIAKVAMDAIKWSSAVRNPKKYGPKQEIEHTGGVTMVMQDLDDKL